MQREVEDEINESVNAWLLAVIGALAVAVSSGYSAGVFKGAGQMKAGVSWKDVKDGAVSFMDEYRKNLEERGIITVRNPVYDDEGKLIRWDTEEVKWLNEMSAEMRSKLMDIISNGIAEGKPAGIIRDKTTGLYKEGSIAREIQDVTDTFKSRAGTIARTETHRAFQNGLRDMYSANGVQYVRWRCMPGACDLCVPLDTKIFRLGEEPDLMHPNCRCELEPYYPSVTDLLVDLDYQ